MIEPQVRLLRRRAAAGGVWIDVSGPSMRPTLDESAEVRVVTADHPRPGELWAFLSRDGAVVVHRYLRRHAEGWYCFRGDGERRDDPPVPSDRLVGRVDRVRDRRGERSPRRSRARVVTAHLRRGRNIPGRLRGG